MRNIISLIQGINTFMTEYSFSETGIIEKTGDESGEMLFFSTTFLNKHNFVVAPIWEGDLDGLILDVNREKFIKPIQNIHNYLIKKGYDEINYIYINSQLPWDGVEGMQNFGVAHKIISLHEYQLIRLFLVGKEPRSYWGDNILFTKDLSLIVYFDGDGFSALAGKKECLAEILTLPVNEIIDIYADSTSERDSYYKWNLACTKFCRDILEMELEKPQVPQ